MIPESLSLLHQDQAIIQEYTFLNTYSAHGRLFKGHSFCIEIDLKDQGINATGRIIAFLADPYIKIGNANKIELSEYITRISLRDPRIVVHSGKQIKVNSRFLRDLNLAMKYQSHYNKFSGTVIECINKFLEDVAKGVNVHFEPIDADNLDFTKTKGMPNNGEYMIC